MSAPNRRGFTLIELLIVVVIIGVLAAATAMQIQTFKRRAATANVKQEMRRVSEQAEAYFATTGSYHGFIAPARPPVSLASPPQAPVTWWLAGTATTPGCSAISASGTLPPRGRCPSGMDLRGMLREGVIGGNTCK